MWYKKLRDGIKEDLEERKQTQLNKLSTEEGFKEVSSWYGKKYKLNGMEKLRKFIYKHYDKQYKEEIAKLEAVENAPDFTRRLVVSVDWKNNYVWGKTCTAHTNYGFNGSCISGCGYCKISTATAEGLNSHLPILKELYKKKERMLNLTNIKDNNGILGYGSGYGILPSFEKGVGWECHKRILEGLWFSMEHVISTNNSDVFIIEREV